MPRLLTPPADRVILYLHGGSFTSGSINTHRFIVAPIVKEANTRALMINYRLAPEHPFPAATEDSYNAYCWLMRQGYSPDRIVVMDGGRLVESGTQAELTGHKGQNAVLQRMQVQE